MKTLYSILLLTLFVLPSALFAEETKTDTLRFNDKEIVKTYDGKFIYVNKHLYDSTDVEDIKLEPDVFVPCQEEANLDLNKLASLVVYPPLARRAGIMGTAYVKCLIGRNDKVLIVIIEFSDNELLNEAAINAVISCDTWTAAVQKGQKIPMWISVPIEFKLNESKKETEDND